ncbi:MAG TPA: SLC13 family permease, partial [Azospirillaceae bacterium]|nr:SLC13 family permease [Azospirillaceae bacterium]
LLPANRQGRAGPEDLFRVESYLTEARLDPASPMVGRTVADLEALSDGEVSVAALIREKYRRFVPASHWTLMAGDVLVLEGDPHALKTVMDGARLHLLDTEESGAQAQTPTSDDTGAVEAVVTESSTMIGCNLVQLALRQRFGVNVLAVGRQGSRSTARLRRIKFQPGDLVVLHGRLDRLPEVLTALGLLPLAERNIRLGRPRQALLPAAIMGLAVVLTVLEITPIAIAFLGAIVAIVVLRLMTLREVYDSVSWPVIVLLGAMIPVSEALRTTGGTDLIAAGLSVVATPLPPVAALTLILVTTMLVTPILNNAATVLVMAPIAASLAARLGLSIDPFLMAVAVGASCDFLTPIGHQSNTLVMGPGGYRFGDYWRLGLPLSLIVVVVGTPLIVAVWPLR